MAELASAPPVRDIESVPPLLALPPAPVERFTFLETSPSGYAVFQEATSGRYYAGKYASPCKTYDTKTKKWTKLENSDPEFINFFTHYRNYADHLPEGALEEYQPKEEVTYSFKGEGKDNTIYVEGSDGTLFTWNEENNTSIFFQPEHKEKTYQNFFLFPSGVINIFGKVVEHRQKEKEKLENPDYGDITDRASFSQIFKTARGVQNVFLSLLITFIFMRDQLTYDGRKGFFKKFIVALLVGIGSIVFSALSLVDILARSILLLCVHPLYLITKKEAFRNFQVNHLILSPSSLLLTGKMLMKGLLQIVKINTPIFSHSKIKSEDGLEFEKAKKTLFTSLAKVKNLFTHIKKGHELIDSDPFLSQFKKQPT